MRLLIAIIMVLLSAPLAQGQRVMPTISVSTQGVLGDPEAPQLLTLTAQNGGLPILDQTDLGISTVYWMRPYSCDAIGNPTLCGANSYLWLYSSNHTNSGVYYGTSNSLDGSDYVDGGSVVTTSQTGYTTPPETPWLIYHPEDPNSRPYYLYSHASKSGGQSTHLHTSADMVTWTFEGEVLPIGGTIPSGATYGEASGSTIDHTGYFRPVRYSPTDWRGPSLLISTSNSTQGYWSSNDGKTWTIRGSYDDAGLAMVGDRIGAIEGTSYVTESGEPRYLLIEKGSSGAGGVGTEIWLRTMAISGIFALSDNQPTDPVITFPSGQGLTAYDDNAGTLHVYVQNENDIYYYTAPVQSRLATVNLSTFSDALAYTGYSVGDTVFVSGQHSPNDGAGGYLRYTNGCEVPNWTTVYVPNNKRASQTDNTTFTSSVAVHSHTASQTPIVPGTYSHTITGTDLGSNPWSVTITDVLMNPSKVFSGDEDDPIIDYATGIWREHRSSGRQLSNLSYHLGSPWSVNLEVNYDYATDCVRLIRFADASGNPIHPSDGAVSPARYDVRWAGAKSDTLAYQGQIDWAMWDANIRREAIPGDVEGIYAPAGVWHTTGHHVVWDSISVYGDGGVDVETKFDPSGFAYRSPIKNVNSRSRVSEDNALTTPSYAKAYNTTGNTVFRILPESGCDDCFPMHYQEYVNNGYGNAGYLPPNAFILAGKVNGTSWKLEYGGEGNKFENIILDGNIENQQGIFASGGAITDPFTLHRNSPSYTGLSQTVHGRGGQLDDEAMQTKNVTAVGFPATAFVSGNMYDTLDPNGNLGNNAGTYIAEGWIHGSDADHNHVFYLQGKTIADSVAFSEDTWGNEVYGFETDYYVAERLGTQGLRTGQGVGGGYLLNNRGCDAYYTATAFDPRECGMIVRSFFVDGRNATVVRAGGWFGGIGTDVQIGNGRIWVGNNSTSIYTPGTGADSMSTGFRLYNIDHIWDIQNFPLVNGDLSDRGEDMIRPNVRIDRGIVSDMRYWTWDGADLTPFTGQAWYHGFRIGSSRARPPSVAGTPVENVFQHIGLEASPIEVSSLVRLSGRSDLQTKWYFRDIHFNNTDNSQTIRDIDGITEAALDSTRLYFDASTFSVRRCTFVAGTTCDIFYRTGHFRNVTDRGTGTTSEDTGSITCDGSNTAQVTTNLFHPTHYEDGVFTVSGETITNITWSQSGSDWRAPIATVTFSDTCTGTQTYNAEVRPFDVIPPYDRVGGADDWMPAEFK